MDGTPVSILIVNYNGGTHLADCLKALERQSLSRHGYEVIVVDNASNDRSYEVIPERFSWCRLIRLSTNVDFAEGNNVAARHAHGRTKILLNNDTIPDPFWLEELLIVMAENPGCAVASKLVFAASPTVINSAGIVLLRDGRGYDLGFREDDCGQFEVSRPIFAGCGAAVSARENHAGNVLDPRYFLYYEDLESGWRARLSGHGTVYAPRSLVRHVHGAAAGDTTPTFAFHVERNRAITSLRYGDPFLAMWTAIVLLFKLFRSILRAIITRDLRNRRHAIAVAKAACSYLVRVPENLIVRYHARMLLTRSNRCVW